MIECIYPRRVWQHISFLSKTLSTYVVNSLCYRCAQWTCSQIVLIGMISIIYCFCWGYALFLKCCGCDTSYIVSVDIQCQAAMYTLLLCRRHSWRVRQAKQETLTPPGNLVSPLVCRGQWMSTVVLFYWCHSYSASVLLYFTFLSHLFLLPCGAGSSTQVLLCLIPGVLWLWHFLYSVSRHPVSSRHIYTFVVSRAFMAGAASQAGDADSSWAPGLTPGLQSSVNVHRGALLLGPQWQWISSFVFYILGFISVEYFKLTWHNFEF